MAGAIDRSINTQVNANLGETIIFLNRVLNALKVNFDVCVQESGTVIKLELPVTPIWNEKHQPTE